MLKKIPLLILISVFLTACTSEQTKNLNENKQIEHLNEEEHNQNSEIEKWVESAKLIRKTSNEDELVFLIGDNGKFGIAEYGPFISGQDQKYMWHFWGDKKTFLKPFKVIGVSERTGERKELFSLPASTMLAPNNGADHHLPSTLKLSEPGLWKLEAYFGEELFGTITVKSLENRSN
ncbi:hypothetical protein ACFVAD_20420 [Sutcliffiella sp. NPDC057660]|uniref:hypothetical protein n=1 Tax=Sutcliffiella sp. NPDC057660 TaxID=3346199 RepID=UPI0036BB0239